jgi:hypothetical protein
VKIALMCLPYLTAAEHGAPRRPPPAAELSGTDVSPSGTLRYPK